MGLWRFRMSRDMQRRSTMESILTQGSLETVSQWEVLMRRFSADCKRINGTCNNVPRDFRSEKLPRRTFFTGSSYDGTWDALGMSGHGVYTFPNGVIYEGEFYDSDFHGRGELRYPNGVKVSGVWEHGHLTERTVIFDDGANFKEGDWPYCTKSDRRFSVEYDKGIQPAGAENRYKTARQPTVDIPEGCYDTCDGIYDPQTNTVSSYEDRTHILRYPEQEERKWIMENCRSSIEPVGPCPKLYEGQQNTELELPEAPSSHSLWAHEKSSESMKSFINANEVGAVWARMVEKSSPKSRGWHKRVIQFNPINNVEKHT